MNFELQPTPHKHTQFSTSFRVIPSVPGMFGLGAQAGHLFKPAFCCDGDSSGGHFPARPMTPPCFGLQDIRAVQPPQLHAPDVPDSLDALQPVNCGELEEDDEDGELSMTLGALKRCQEKKAEQVELKRFLSRHRRVAARNLFGVRFLALYPIHVAAKLGKPQMVKVLLRAGADKEKNTSQGRLRNGGPCNRKKDLVL